MKNALLLSMTMLPLSIVCYGQDTEIMKRPNIILFLVDDMGWQDTSLPFWTERTHYNDIYETPNMERLAQQGVKFTQAYACSISSPSRCSLFSGMNAARHWVTNWTLKKDISTDGKNDVLTMADWNVNGLSPIPGIKHTTYVTPLSQVLKDNDYYTIHCGKAHLGAAMTQGENPLKMGFDVNIAGHAGGAPASYLGEENFGNREDNQPSSPFAVPGLEEYWHHNIFLTEVLTLEAKKALDKARTTDKPFFLYMAHYAVHIPYSKDSRFYQKYRDKGLPDSEARYASLVEGMDKSLGDLMDYLDAHQLTDNTIILFMSDNGGFAASSDVRAGLPFTQNYPLNSGKGSAYEGGIREPMIVKWPGVTQGGTICDKPVIIEDFFPSILQMADIKKYKTVQTIDGLSFVPLLTGQGDPSAGRRFYWNYPNDWGVTGPGIGATCAVRDGDWKLIYYYQDGHKELFNIRKDIGEKHNLVSSEPAQVKRLSTELGKYLRKVGGQRPGFKATGKPVCWPDK